MSLFRGQICIRIAPSRMAHLRPLDHTIKLQNQKLLPQIQYTRLGVHIHVGAVIYRIQEKALKRQYTKKTGRGASKKKLTVTLLGNHQFMLGVHLPLDSISHSVQPSSEETFIDAEGVRQRFVH